MINKIFIGLCMAMVPLWSVSLEHKIGQMLMVGFHGTSAPKNSKICQAIRRYNVGGVILFDYNPVDKSKPKNISSKSQLKKLTRELQACSKDHKLLIAVDQEGGRVQRLKHKYGFLGNFPQANQIHNKNPKEIKKIYIKMGKELKNAGINYDLAPVVDLDINKKNHVIHELGRSYGSNPVEVAKNARIFIEAMHENHVLTAIKHFPGHGSSVGDTHKGFVDVSNLWQEKELKPYKLLKNDADTVMVAHVFNKKIDPSLPASLSYAAITKKLRKEIGYSGVVITDDLQMGAISQKYTLKKTLKLAINAGNDILLFGNQLDPKKTVETKELVDTIISLIKSGAVKQNSINSAYNRIQRLKHKL